MKGKGYWVIRTYRSGNVGEKIKYFIPSERPKSKRQYKSDLRKQAQNDYSAEKNVARLINANFKQGDVLLGLDYGAAGYEKLCMTFSGFADEEEYMQKIRAAAEHEMKLAVRRVKRELAKNGIDFKYIAITSDMDGDTGAAVRVHHHLIVNAEAATIFEKKWTNGGVHVKRLREQEDYTAIAAYFIAQVRKVPDAKKYASSRNLIRPQPKDRIVTSDAELKPPKGCKLLFRSEYNHYKPQYIRYYIPPVTGADQCPMRL